MTQELLNIIISALSIIVTGLVGWGVTVLTTWLNSKIKDKKVANWVTQITKIVTDAVMSVFQVFVEGLKKEGKFGLEEAKEAKERAISIIKTQLTPELVKYIQDNYGDMEEWLSMQVETAIYSLKCTAKK